MHKRKQERGVGDVEEAGGVGDGDGVGGVPFSSSCSDGVLVLEMKTLRRRGGRVSLWRWCRARTAKGRRLSEDEAMRLGFPLLLK